MRGLRVRGKSIKLIRRQYKVAATWESYGTFEIEANDKDDFLAKVKALRDDNDEIAIPENQKYVDATFVIEDDDLQLAVNDLLE